MKLRRRYSDDGNQVAVDAYGAAENRAVAVEIVYPKPVADDCRERFCPVAVFVASEGAAQERLQAQNVEVVSGDQFEPRGIRLFSVADGGGSRLVQDQSGDFAARAIRERAGRPSGPDRTCGRPEGDGRRPDSSPQRQRLDVVECRPDDGDRRAEQHRRPRRRDRDPVVDRPAGSVADARAVRHGHGDLHRHGRCDDGGRSDDAGCRARRCADGPVGFGD